MKDETVYHNIDVVTHDDGSATIYSETNDNLDSGYPSEYARWSTNWANAKSALEYAGKSRIGCMGAVVTVTVNGDKVV